MAIHHSDFFAKNVAIYSLSSGKTGNFGNLSGVIALTDSTSGTLTGKKISSFLFFLECLLFIVSKDVGAFSSCGSHHVGMAYAENVQLKTTHPEIRFQIFKGYQSVFNFRIRPHGNGIR